MSCTAADLINIQPLTLSDTFSTWFDRTNEVIGVANNLNIYDIGLGATSGLFVESGCSGGYYNGLALVSVNVGAGLGIGSGAFTNNVNKVVVDAHLLEDLGTGASSNPATDDYIIVADVSDGRQGTSGTPKRTSANRMLPPIVTFGDSGNGSFTIQGDVNIVGSLNVSDSVSYIDSNDLRIEDKVIELALNRYVQFVVQGSGLTAETFVGGQTAFYLDSGTPVPSTATSIGKVRSWSLGSSTTGTIQVHSFSEGGVNDFVLGGSLVVTGASYLSVLTVTSQPSISTDYFNDELLTPAGIDIKGASGDKTFLWNYRTPDLSETWNAFMANTNLGVTGAGNSIISSRFSAYGYGGGANDTFTFEGQGSSYSKIAVGTELSMEHSPAGAAGVTFGIVAIGSTGTTYPNSPVYAWVRRFNADQLDGAHASTAAAAWTIPVSLTDGRVHEDFIRADGVRKVFSVANSGFAVGDVVRIKADGSLTFAKADTVPTAEVFGMVETVHGDRISVVSEGHITGLNGTRINALIPLVTGNVYYLSAAVAGGLITNPDEGAFALSVGQVRRAVLLATDSDKGYVTAYAGTVVGGGSPTDLVYLPTVAPVGTVQPYTGSHNSIPNGWLLCDGKALRPNSYPDLHEVIGQTYYATAVGASPTTIVIDGDTRNLAVGDGILLRIDSGQTLSTNITTIDSATRVITFANPFGSLTVGAAVRVYGRTDTTFPQVFFLPDMRTRTILGTSFGDGLSGSGVINPQLALGSLGGNAYVPEHQHSLGTAVQTGGGAFGSSLNQTGGPITQVSNLPPYATAHWIIRSVKTLPAIIITGHNHDESYIRYNIPHTVGAGAGTTLTLNNRSQFRSNAMVLSKETDDSTSRSLGISGNLQVTGTSRFGNKITVTGGHIEVLNTQSVGQREWDSYTVRGGTAITSVGYDFVQAQVRILSETPSLVLFSPTGGNLTLNETRGKIVHYGAQTTSPQEALITGSLGFAQRGGGASDVDNASIPMGQQEFRVGLNIAGRNSSGTFFEDTALLITRKDTTLRGTGSIRYRLPNGLTSGTTADVLRRVYINNNGELKQAAPADDPFNFLAISYPAQAYIGANNSTNYDSSNPLILLAGTWMVHAFVARENAAANGSDDVRASVATVLKSSLQMQIRRITDQLQYSLNNGTSWTVLIDNEGGAMNPGFFGWAMKVG